jgi:hypothetical protein
MKLDIPHGVSGFFLFSAPFEANYTTGRFSMKAVWEKVFEYASMPVHGSLSRKLRKGIRVQVNEGKIYEEATLFLGEEFLRISEEDGTSEALNSYYDWKMVSTVRTYSKQDEEQKKRK